MKQKSHVLLLTGTPGIGKTTMIRHVAEQLNDKRLSGFYTREIRSGGYRKGFELICFNGQARVFAHVDFPKHFRVSKYGVDVTVLDNIAENVLSTKQRVDLYLVDEIGRMECFSEKFVCAIRKLLNSDEKIVATVALRGTGLIEEVKQRRDVTLWKFTHENRDEMCQKVLNWLSE